MTHIHLHNLNWAQEFAWTLWVSWVTGFYSQVHKDFIIRNDEDRALVALVALTMAIIVTIAAVGMAYWDGWL